jgi:hypothetical protein
VKEGLHGIEIWFGEFGSGFGFYSRATVRVFTGSVGILVPTLVRSRRDAGRHVDRIDSSSVSASDADQSIDYISKMTVHANGQELANLGSCVWSQCKIISLGQLG